MTPEEIQSMMEFILRSQADAAVRMEQIQGSHKTLQSAVGGLLEAPRNLLDVTKFHSRRLDRLEGDLG